MDAGYEDWLKRPIATFLNDVFEEIKKRNPTYYVPKEPESVKDVSTRTEEDTEDYDYLYRREDESRKRRHECEICAKPFERARHLKAHRLSHGDERTPGVDRCNT